MLTLFFIILMFAVWGELFTLAIKAAWGITKILVAVVLFPLVLIVMACTGLMYLALICLVIGGIVALVSSVIV